MRWRWRVRKKSTPSLPLHQTSSKPPQNRINKARLTNNSSKKHIQDREIHNRDDQQRYRCQHTRTGSYELRLSLAAASIYIHPQLHTKPTPRGRTSFKLIQADGTWREPGNLRQHFHHSLQARLQPTCPV
jgi:hypothetical protein